MADARKTFAKPSHCSYRGCMKPLPGSAVKSMRDQRWYCDDECGRRNAKFERRVANEERASVAGSPSS